MEILPPPKSQADPLSMPASPTLLLCQRFPVLGKALKMQIFAWVLDSFPPISNSLWLWPKVLTLAGTAGSQLTITSFPMARTWQGRKLLI